MLASNLACPPCNVGPASTPNYDALAAQAVHQIGGGRTVFAGQRFEGFYVDLGAIFDLADRRPFQNLHISSMPAAAGVNATNDFSVHSIALKVPKRDLTRDGSKPTDAMDRRSVIGVWAAASRRRAVIREPRTGSSQAAGPWVQVSRLGNPLFNEVIVPMGEKDLWNSLSPADDGRFLQFVQHPELASLLPVLYPGVFPNLAGLTAARADLVAILLTGIPSGIVAGFQNYTGSHYADELRLNLAIPPTTSDPNPLGLIGGDLAGFPNGRRVFDDVVTVELRANRRGDVPARQQELHARWGRVADHRRARPEQHPLSVPVPVSRDSPGRLPDRAASDSLSRRNSHGNGATNGATAEPDHTPARAASASVALDIGPGRGALVIYPDERFRGREIEISPVDGDGRRVHTGVHERSTQAGSMLTAIFGSLPPGDYIVWEDATTAGTTVTVAEEKVAELRLS